MVTKTGPGLVVVKTGPIYFNEGLTRVKKMGVERDVR